MDWTFALTVGFALIAIALIVWTLRGGNDKM